MKNITTRTFTFDVIVCETADGRVSKRTVGGPWLRLSKKMVKDGTAKLTCVNKGFHGYGRSYDYGYHCVSYTVTEIV
jgi:hypothetical protein